MSIGTPIVITEATGQRQFTPLSGVSVRRDDPNSFDECLLQELIDAEPNILPIRDFLPSTTTLFSLGREVPVDIGGSDGYIDNLLVTNDGYIVIVETKLYRNPEATRDVVIHRQLYFKEPKGFCNYFWAAKNCSHVRPNIYPFVICQLVGGEFNRNVAANLGCSKAKAKSI